MKPEMNAVCSIMVAVVGVAVIAASLLDQAQCGARHAGRRGLINPRLSPGGRNKIDHEPDRDDHQRAEQQFGSAQANAVARQVFDPLRRQSGGLDQLARW